MTADHDDILDSLFHGCAWAAYLDQAAEEGGWPSREGTRRRAYRYYEDALAAKNRRSWLSSPPRRRPVPPSPA